ncbi:MAG: LacI family DNA-binding transcriptional regulator [Chloroflexi bacterium]|nr:LacI family DNA-binding transcriptional regulator [Chloroflexota bacterium]
MDRAKERILAHSTVYDVALKAGVSIATVSRVINAPDKVNPETRQRVLEAISKLHYVPKAEAAARARKGTGRIGVIAPFFAYPSFIQRLRGVASALAALPYELTVYNVDNSAHRDGLVASVSLTRRLDGLILMALPFNEATVENLISHSLATVSIECAHPSFSSIEIDDANGGRIAARYLIEKGHRKLAFIGESNLPEYAFPTSDHRLDGYRAAIQSASLELNPVYIAYTAHKIEDAFQAVLQMLNLPEPPTAVFCASDTHAMGALQAARQRGIRVPDELAILGFDDLDIASYLGLTTIRQHLDESGRRAVELLMSRLTHPERPTQHVRLPLELVVRETA